MPDNKLVTDRMDIYVDESRRVILLQQKWKYNWIKFSILPSVKEWTYVEKKAFHHKADNLIWKLWSNKFKIKVDGNSEFAKKNKGREFTVDFDIEWVLSGEHWKVDVLKIAAEEHMENPTWVNWDKRKIQLLNRDDNLREVPMDGHNYYQYPVAHEFGHAAGNLALIGHWDEYRDGGIHNKDKSVSKYLYDKKSMMNIGNELRIRHLDYLCSLLRIMFATTSFEVIKY